jgi:MFS family permease
MKTHDDKELETTSETKSSKRKQVFVALQNRDYRLLWTSQLVSQIGTQMRITGIGWQVYILTKDPLLLGVVGLCRVVPLVLCSLVGGPAADALDRRKLLIITQTILLVCSAILAFVTMTGTVNIWWIYAITIITSGVNAFDRPAYVSMIPALVTKPLLPNAISLNVLSFQVATVSGPAITGFLIATVGVMGVYWIDTLTYGGVIAALLMMRFRPSVTSGNRVSVKAALEGLKYVFTTKILISCMLLDFLATFFGTARLMLPIIVVEVLKADNPELAYGFLSSAESVGAVIASTVLAYVNVNAFRRPGVVLLGAVASYSLFTMLFGLSSIIWLSFIFAALVGASDTLSMSLRQTISQLTTPDELRGRMVSVNLVFVMGGPQLGELRAGLLTRALGVQWAIVLGGLGCLITTFAIAKISRSLRNFEFDKNP